MVETKPKSTITVFLWIFLVMRQYKGRKFRFSWSVILQNDFCFHCNALDVDSDFDEEALNKELKKARLNHCLPSDFTSNGLVSVFVDPLFFSVCYNTTVIW